MSTMSMSSTLYVSLKKKHIRANKRKIMETLGKYFIKDINTEQRIFR